MKELFPSRQKFRWTFHTVSKERVNDFGSYAQSHVSGESRKTSGTGRLLETGIAEAAKVAADLELLNGTGAKTMVGIFSSTCQNYLYISRQWQYSIEDERTDLGLLGANRLTALWIYYFPP
jgi:hypothetical protein